MTAIQDFQYRPDRAFIREGLGRYRNTTAVVSALALAEHILSYSPDHGWTWQHQLQSRMLALRAAGKSPLEIVQRVAEHYALADRQPHLFKTQRSEHSALAATYCI